MGAGFVQGELIWFDLPSGALLDQTYGLHHGRVRLQAQNIHLHQAQRGHIILVELGYHHSLGRPLQGSVMGDLPVCDDETSQVGA